MQIQNLSAALVLLDEVRNWFHEAPIDELEAVEKALQRNAPIHELSTAIEHIALTFPKGDS